jgi:hypothetical protein
MNNMAEEPLTCEQLDWSSATLAHTHWQQTNIQSEHPMNRRDAMNPPAFSTRAIQKTAGANACKHTHTACAQLLFDLNHLDRTHMQPATAYFWRLIMPE